MEPRDHLGEGFGGEVVVALSSDLLLDDEVGVSQHLQVLGHRGSAQSELVGERARLHRSVDQQLEESPAHRVGESVEDRVISHHAIMSDISDMSRISDAFLDQSMSIA
jgi:hypothetical protein